MKGRKTHMQIRGNSRTVMKKVLQAERHNSQQKAVSVDSSTPLTVTRTTMIQAARSYRKNSHPNINTTPGTIVFGIFYPVIQRLYYNEVLPKKSLTCWSESEKALQLIQKGEMKPNSLYHKMFKTVLWGKVGFEPGTRAEGVEYSFDKDIIRFTYFVNGFGKVFMLMSLLLLALGFALAYAPETFRFGSYVCNSVIAFMVGYFGADYRKFCNEDFRKKAFWSSISLIRRSDIVSVLYTSVIAQDYDIQLVEQYKSWLDCIKALHRSGATFGISESQLNELDTDILSLSSETRNLAIARVAFLRDFIFDYGECRKPKEESGLHFE